MPNLTKWAGSWSVNHGIRTGCCCCFEIWTWMCKWNLPLEGWMFVVLVWKIPIDSIMCKRKQVHGLCGRCIHFFFFQTSIMTSWWEAIEICHNKTMFMCNVSAISHHSFHFCILLSWFSPPMISKIASPLLIWYYFLKQTPKKSNWIRENSCDKASSCKWFVSSLWNIIGHQIWYIKFCKMKHCIYFLLL